MTVSPLGRTSELEDRLGKSLSLIGIESRFEIVGVLAGYRYQGLREEPPSFVFLPDAQHEALPQASGFMMPRRAVLVRTSGEPASIVPAVRSVVAAMDRSLPLLDVTTLEQRLRGARAQETQAAGIFSGFSICASRPVIPSEHRPCES